MARVGRRAVDLSVDTRPGKVLALSLVANAPVFVGFVLTPLFAQGDRTAALTFVPLVLWVTPIFALSGLFVYARADAAARNHRAARIGLLLCVLGLLLFALVLAAVLTRGA